MSASKYPKLAQFLGSYFHQDWTLESESSEAVVKSYKAKAGAKKLQDLVAELDGLLGEKLKEPQLKKKLGDLGCCVDPDSEGKTASAWLTWLRAALLPSKSK